jgi:hypothetical protein
MSVQPLYHLCSAVVARGVHLCCTHGHAVRLLVSNVHNKSAYHSIISPGSQLAAQYDIGALTLMVLVPHQCVCGALLVGTTTGHIGGAQDEMPSCNKVPTVSTRTRYAIDAA